MMAPQEPLIQIRVHTRCSKRPYEKYWFHMQSNQLLNYIKYCSCNVFSPVSGIRSLLKKHFLLNSFPQIKAQFSVVQPGDEKLESDKLWGGEDKLLSFVPVRIPQTLFINNFHNPKYVLLLIRNLQYTSRAEFLGYYSYIQVLAFGPFLQHSSLSPAQRVHCDKFYFP